jgi:hypothetical protein
MIHMTYSNTIHTYNLRVPSTNFRIKKGCITQASSYSVMKRLNHKIKVLKPAIRVSVILLLSVCTWPYFKWKFKSVLRTYKEEIRPFAVTPDTDSYYAFIFVFKISIVFLLWHALQPWTHTAVCVNATLDPHSSLAQPAKYLWNYINPILFCFKGTQHKSVSLFMEARK